MADLANSSIDVVLSLHEALVLCLDLVDDASSVDVALPLSPVNGRKAGVGRGLVEELNHSLDLSELVATLVGVGGQSQSVQPFAGQVVVLLGVVYNGAVGGGGSKGGRHVTAEDALSKLLSKAARHII